MTMMTEHRAGMHKNPGNNIESLESYLFKNLEPVKPRQEFVRHLQGRLGSSKRQPQASLTPIEWIILVVAGFAGSLIVLITGLKAASSIAEAFRVLRRKRVKAPADR